MQLSGYISIREDIIKTLIAYDDSAFHITPRRVQHTDSRIYAAAMRYSNKIAVAMGSHAA